jgi:hypothetical protein
VFIGACRDADRDARSAERAAADWFVDRAADSGLTFIHTNGLSGQFYLHEVIGSGVALVDYDNDGDLDVYAVQGAGGEGGRLFRNELGEGMLRFTDVTAASGIVSTGYGMGVAAADYNNDGCVDLYLTNFGANRLYRNNCTGTFVDATGESGTADPGWSVSAAFADVDRDGWLDLFVGHYLNYSIAANTPCYSLSGQLDYCQPSAYSPQPSHFFRNNRDGTFTDVTAASGMAREYGPALGVLSADVDGDGWVDIFVANDGAPNNLWVNQRNGTFRNTALPAGVAVSPEGLAKASMGLDAGDFDGDGDEDIFITELTGQGADLYVNDGTGVFTDLAARAGLRAPTLPLTGFGTAWIDADNDGWLDLATVNGAVTHTAEALARKQQFALQQRKQLFRNRGPAPGGGGEGPVPPKPSGGVDGLAPPKPSGGVDGLAPPKPGSGVGGFEDVTAQAGAVFQIAEVGRGAAFGDVDNDGDTDIVVANANGPLRLLINSVGQERHWVGLRLMTGPRDALGARVAITRPDGSVLWRRARSDGSYASANDARVLAGLGVHASIDRVRVLWPDGSVEVWAELDANRYHTLMQGTGTREP